MRKAGAVVSPPRRPFLEQIEPLTDAMKTGLGYLVAFWPLTAVVLVCAALIWAVGYNASP